MIRRLSAILLWACLAGAALAQLRSIPENAKRATLRHVQDMTVEMDGERRQLAAGAQIRDADNRIVLPTALPANVLVKHIPDMHGQVWRVWILSPQEAAQPDRKQ